MAVDVATEQVLHHLGADAVEGRQAHQEARVVHDVTGSCALHVLLQRLLDVRVEAVHSARLAQPHVTCTQTERDRGL